MFDIFVTLVNLRPFESCDWSDQCNGDTGANECKVVEGQQICYCREGKEILEGMCIKGKYRQYNQCISN